jgi:flagellar motor switch protein FliM
MSINDVLTHDEIDALLHSLDSSEVETVQDEIPPGEAWSYDFTSQDRIVHGHMPTLEMINERFARQLRINLFNMLRRNAKISVDGVKVMKYAEYVHSLHVPSSLNLVKVRPLRGTALFILDPKLVFTVVDTFFGGDGSFGAKLEEREFTHTENRVIQMVLNAAFENLAEAWAPVMNVNFEFLNSEVNPQFANIVSPSELVVVSKFDIDLEGSSGAMHVTMPYSMVEPVRDLLDAGMQGDRSDVDERWAIAVREELQSAPVNLSSTLLEVELTLGEVLHLNAGDIIPADISEKVTLCAEGVPVYEGLFGVANGNNAIKVTNEVQGRMLVQPSLSEVGDKE